MQSLHQSIGHDLWLFLSFLCGSEPASECGISKNLERGPKFQASDNQLSRRHGEQTIVGIYFGIHHA